jgi:hypothetical protein
MILNSTITCPKCGHAAADAHAAARQLVQLASSIEPVQDGRIHIEKINYPFLYTLRGSGAEFGAGIRCAVEKGWLELHESGTYVQLLTSGQDTLSPR